MENHAAKKRNETALRALKKKRQPLCGNFLTFFMEKGQNKLFHLTFSKLKTGRRREKMLLITFMGGFNGRYD